MSEQGRNHKRSLSLFCIVTLIRSIFFMSFIMDIIQVFITRIHQVTALVNHVTNSMNIWVTLEVDLTKSIQAVFSDKRKDEFMTTIVLLSYNYMLDNINQYSRMVNYTPEARLATADTFTLKINNDHVDTSIAYVTIITINEELENQDMLLNGEIEHEF